MTLSLVTGLAGAGKSAVMREFVLSAPEAVDFALHARNLAVNEVAYRIAEALSLPFDYEEDELRAAAALELLALRAAEVAGRGRSRPLIVVDSLDEAREQAPSVARFLRSLAHGCDVVVGLRTGHELLVRQLSPGLVIDLDVNDYFRGADLRRFVERLLSSEGYPWQDSAGDALVAEITQAAQRNFLVAGLLALARAQAHKRGQPWRHGDLPRSVSGAMRLFIERLPNQDCAWEMLLPPALAQGMGWPVRLWHQAVAALADRPCPAAEIAAFRGSAAEYLIEEGYLPGETTVRTYHDALGETVVRERVAYHPLRQLRETPGAMAYDHGRLAQVLEQHVRDTGWDRASPYARRYLAVHALKAGKLADKLQDVEFLCAADPLELHHTLVASGGLLGLPPGECHEMAVHLLGPDRQANAYLMQLAAQYHGYLELAERIAAAHPASPYAVPWAAVLPSDQGERDGHGDWITATCAFQTADGWRVASASSDRTIRVWDPAAPGSRALLVLNGHTDCVRDLVAFQVDGAWRLASASDDGTVRIWDPLGAAGASALRILVGHTDWVRAVKVFAVGGTWYLVSGSDDRTIRVWELDGASEPIRTMVGHAGWVLTLQPYQSAQGWRVASGSSDGTLMIWDPTSDEARPLRAVEGHSGSVRALACYADDRRIHLVSCGDDAAVRIWDLTDDAPSLERELAGHTHSVRGLVTFTVDGAWHLGTASSDQLIRIWDLSQGDEEPGSVLVGHNDWVRAISAFQTDEGWSLATGGDDGTLRLWRLTGPASAGSERVFSRDLRWLRAVAVIESDGGARVATGGTDGHLRIWDPTRPGAAPIAVLDGHDTWVRSICVVGAGEDTLLVSAGDDGAIKVWNINSPDGALVQVLLEHQAPVRGVCSFEQDLQWHVASVGDDAAVRLWSVEEGRLRPTGLLTGHTDWIRTVHAFRLGSRRCLATGGDDQTIRIWDLGAAREKGREYLPQVLTGHTDAVRGICTFGRGPGVRMASTSDDGSVRLWNPDSKETTAEQVFHAHKASGLGICAREAGHDWEIATVSADHTVKVRFSSAPETALEINTLTPNYAIAPVGSNGFIVGNQLGALVLQVAGPNHARMTAST